MAKVGSSAKFYVLVFKASMLYYLGESFCQSYVCLPSFVYWYSRHLYSIKGGPLAKVGSSAMFGVAVFKASILNSLVGSIDPK